MQDEHLYELGGNVRNTKCTKCKDISKIKPFNDAVIAGDNAVKCSK